MPINKKYSLKENIEALKSYSAKTNTRITFEYVMLEGINDRDEDIKTACKIDEHDSKQVEYNPFQFT